MCNRKAQEAEVKSHRFNLFSAAVFSASLPPTHTASDILLESSYTVQLHKQRISPTSNLIDDG